MAKQNSSKANGAAAQGFKTTISPGAGELADQLAAIWTKRDQEKADPEAIYTRAHVLADALALGLHFLGLRDLGDRQAWDPDYQIGTSELV